MTDQEPSSKSTVLCECALLFVSLQKGKPQSLQPLTAGHDEKAKQVLGLSADDIAKLKHDRDQVPFESVLKRAMWSEWIVRIQSRTQYVLQSKACSILYTVPFVPAWCPAEYCSPRTGRT